MSLFKLHLCTASARRINNTYRNVCPPPACPGLIFSTTQAASVAGNDSAFHYVFIISDYSNSALVGTSASGAS
jgi:hypothetical protein